LIKKDEVDIYEVSIERITSQYLEYIGTFKILNIELVSEFVVMAANLMYIKSRTLLPRHEQPPGEEIEEESAVEEGAETRDAASASPPSLSRPAMIAKRGSTPRASTAS
ncbi:MAG: segregation/condensation protein A, partial [bacterium]